MPTTRRILIVKLGAIGDVIMAIPAAHLLHQQGYEIDWLCSITVAPILQLYPWINAIPVDEKSLLRSGKLSTLKSLLPLWRKLSGRNYDTIATLYYDSRYKLLTFPIAGKRKFTLSNTDRATQLLPGRHHTDEYARILSGRPDDVTPTQLSPVIPQNFPSLPYPASSTPRAVIIPAGARNLLRDDALRRWPLDNYVLLTKHLLSAGYEVILAGGPDDTWASPAFADLNITDLTGKLTLPQTLSLLHSAAVTITHDTGPLHLAGLTKTKIVGIFGPTDPRGRLPQRHNTVALWGGEGFACRPCYDGRNYANCTTNGCIQQITPAMVFAEITTLMNATQPLLPRIRTPKHTALTQIQ